jgi:hypothetical protein
MILSPSTTLSRRPQKISRANSWDFFYRQSRRLHIHYSWKPVSRTLHPILAFGIRREARAMTAQSFSTQDGLLQGVKLVNRLSESRSPYVRGHMNNPVAWQMWTPEALALAKKTDRLLFVSIGYSACHCMSTTALCVLCVMITNHGRL